MLRFPIIHKGWIPKKGRPLTMPLFWLNKSDMLLTYDKRDIEVKMEFGDIPHEELDDKNWDWVNQKKKEIEELEEYREKEKQAYIIPMRSIQQQGSTFDQYLKQTQQYDFKNLNKRYEQFQTLMNSKGIFDIKQDNKNNSLCNMTPIPTEYLNKLSSYEQSLLFLAQKQQMLNYEEITFLQNADITKKFNNSDIYEIACNKYFDFDTEKFEIFFQNCSIKDQKLFQKAIENCIHEGDQEPQLFYALKLFKNNDIDNYYQDKLVKMYNEQKSINCLKKLIILKIFQNNIQKVPLNKINLDQIFLFINTNPEQNNNLNKNQNVLLLKNILYKGFILDRIMDYDNIKMTQINLYLSVNILNSLKNNKIFSFYLYQYNQIFGQNNLQKNILLNLQKIQEIEITQQNKITIMKSIQEFQLYLKQSHKPAEWFKKSYFIVDNQQIVVCDRLNFSQNEIEQNNLKQKIKFYEKKKFDKNQKQFDLQMEYEFQQNNKTLLEDLNFAQTNTDNFVFENIEKSYKQKYIRNDITNKKIINMKTASALKSLNTLLKSSRFQFSQKFQNLKEKMKKNFNQINKDNNIKGFNRLLKKMSDPEYTQTIDEFDNQIQEFKFNNLKDYQTKLYFMLTFDEYIDSKKYFKILKAILLKNKLPNQNQYSLTFQSNYGHINLDLNKYLINEQFYQSYQGDELKLLFNQTIQYRTQFLIPVYLSILLKQQKYNELNFQELLQYIIDYKQSDWVIFIIQYSIENQLQLQKKTIKMILNYIQAEKYYQKDYIRIYLKFLEQQEQCFYSDYFEHYVQNINQQEFEKIYYDLNKILQQQFHKNKQTFDDKYIDYLKLFYSISYENDYIDICQQIVFQFHSQKIVNLETFQMQYSILAKDLTLMKLLMDSFQQFIQLNNRNYQFKDQQQIQIFVDSTCNIIEKQEIPLKLHGNQFLFEFFNKIFVKINQKQTDQIIDSLSQIEDIKHICYLFANMNKLWNILSLKQFKFSQYLLRNAGQIIQREKIEEQVQKCLNKVNMNISQDREDIQFSINEKNDIDTENKIDNDVVEETGLPFSLMLHVTKLEIKGTRLEINDQFEKIPKISKKFLANKNKNSENKMSAIDQSIDKIFDWKKEYNEVRSEQLSDQEILLQELQQLRKKPYLSKYLLEAMKNGKKWQEIYPEDDKIYRRDIIPILQDHFKEFTEEYNQENEEII